MTGGTGLIGGHLAEYFFKEGEISKGIFRKGSHLRIMDQCGIQCLEGYLMDRHTLHEPLDMVDVVYNLAFPPPRSSEEDYAKLNDVGLSNLLEEANEHGVKVFVHLSCLDVYGGGRVGAATTPSPRDSYERAKVDAEQKVLAFGEKNPDMKVRVVRAAKTVGPRDTSITLPILKMAEQGKVVLPSGSSSTVSLSHPKDIAQSLLRAATYTGTSRTFLVKSFDASLADFTGAVLNATGRKAEIRSAGLLSGKTLVSPYASDEIKSGIVLESQDSWREISYAPAYTIEKTAEEVSEWLRKEPWSTKSLA